MIVSKGSARSLLLSGVAAMFVVGAAPAWAAEEAADAAAKSSIDNNGDIVITAQKRETRLQDTPAAITAVSESTLENAAIVGINDLARAVPSLGITDGGPGQRRVALRGIRSSGEPQVGIYYDEAPLAGPPGTTSDTGGNVSDFTLFDVERVEVLRGPQGTLYGAGSMGGTVRLISRKPDFNYAAGFDLIGSTTAHAGENYQVNAMVNVPIVDGVLAARAVYYRRESAGWIDNPGLGLSKINDEFSQGGRIMVRFIPSHWLTIDGAVHFSENEGVQPVWAPSLGKYNSGNRIYPGFEDKSRLYTLSADADLGFARLVVSGSYQDRESLFIRDPYYRMLSSFDSVSTCARRYSTPFCQTAEGMAEYNAYVSSVTPLAYVSPQTMDNYTGEARLQSKGDGLLTWTVGGYWSNRESWVGSDGILVDEKGALLRDEPLVYTRQVEDQLRQLAAFGEATIKPLEGLSITGGLRYYDYKRIVAGDTQKGFDLINFAVQPWTVRETNDTGWLYKVNVAYKFSRDLMVYGQAASGFRPGGANQVLGLPSSFTPYDPDSLWTYEGGFKATALDGTLRVNVAGYVTDWTNLQVSGNSGTFSFLTNAGDARIKGIEIEAVANPTRGLEFSATMNLVDAKLTKDQINDLVVASGRKGDRVPYIPQVSWSFGGQYNWDVTDSLKGLARFDLNYVGRSYADFRPNAITYRALGDYTLLGARVGVNAENWGIHLFATNLLDEVARTSASNMIGGSLEMITTVPPRTFGIQLSGNF